MRTTEDAVYFWGDEDFLSNFHPATINLGRMRFPTSEHLFMWKKANHFPGNEDVKAKILKTKLPYDAKKLGRQVKGYDESEWTHHRYDAMLFALRAKFAQNPELADLLIETGDKQLVEASQYDRIWGIGLSEDIAHKVPREEWPGQNLLGKALMEIRDELNDCK